MTRPVKVLGISGSLRRGSYNTSLLRAAAELVPEGMTLEISEEIGKLPLYDDDVRAAGFPEPVVTLRQKLAAADAVLMVSPEYNYSIPGVLKNAIDWASRAPDQPFDGKALAIMGATPGNWGTARMQYHLRQVAVFLNLQVLNKPEVLVARAPDKFDADGRLTDEPTRKVVADQLLALRDFTRRVRGL